MTLGPTAGFGRLRHVAPVAWLALAPIGAAIAAFQLSARHHALDAILANAMCGGPAMTSGAPEFLGHCMACWSAAVSTGLGTLALMLFLVHAVQLVVVPT